MSGSTDRTRAGDSADVTVSKAPPPKKGAKAPAVKRLKPTEPIQWTGDNLAAVKKLHPKARHYTGKHDDPDILYLDDAEGNTFPVQKGRTIRVLDGRLIITEEA